jgi:hypothetical protein
MIVGFVLGVAALAFVIYRQVVPRKVSSSSFRIVAIFAIIGVVEAVQYFRGNGNHVDGVTYAALGGSLVLAAGFGAIRAFTVKLWTQDGETWQKGTWITGALWILALAAHLGYDYLVAPGHGTKSVGDATALLYVAVSLLIQRLIVQYRAGKMDLAGPSPGLATPSA